MYKVYFRDGSSCELEKNLWEEEQKWIERIVKMYHAVKIIRKNDGVVVHELAEE